MPIFFENDDILGRVEIDLDKAESAKGIAITVSFRFCTANFLCSFYFEIESVLLPLLVRIF